jgi:hypothetical protein
MKALMSAEFLKLRTLRVTWIVATAAVALAAVIGVVLVRYTITNPLPDGQPLTVNLLANAPMEVLWFVAIALCIVISAGEYQHKTIRTTLLFTPRRSRILAAKVAVAGAFGASLVALGMAASVASGAITATLSAVHVTTGGGVGWGAAAAGIGLGASWAVLATGLGILTRSTALAISAVLLWRFVGEGLLPQMTGHPEITRWTPLGATNALDGLPGLLPVWGAALLFVGYSALVWLSAAAVFIRRDPA